MSILNINPDDRTIVLFYRGGVFLLLQRSMLNEIINLED
jgi:hypothetical protein